MALKDLIQRVATLRVCFIEKRGNKHPSNKTVCIYQLFVYIYQLFVYLFSGQINSVHYRDETSEKEYICSSEVNSGMHKCSKLPVFVENGMECHAR